MPDSKVNSAGKMDSTYLVSAQDSLKNQVEKIDSVFIKPEQKTQSKNVDPESYAMFTGGMFGFFASFQVINDLGNCHKPGKFLNTMEKIYKTINKPILKSAFSLGFVGAIALGTTAIGVGVGYLMHKMFQQDINRQGQKNENNPKTNVEQVVVA